MFIENFAMTIVDIICVVIGFNKISRVKYLVVKDFHVVLFTDNGNIVSSFVSEDENPSF